MGFATLATPKFIFTLVTFFFLLRNQTVSEGIADPPPRARARLVWGDTKLAKRATLAIGSWFR